MESSAFHVLSYLMVLMGVASALVIALDIGQRQPQAMGVMTYVWPINALWAGAFGIWVYWRLGRMGPKMSPTAEPQKEGTDGKAGERRGGQSMGGMEMGGDTAHRRDGAPVHTRPFWESIVSGTLHCGAGCTLADLGGPFLFRAIPFLVAGSAVFGEWTLDYIVALLIGVTFQYAALSPMLGQRGAPIWWRALKVDFLSLTAWQVGMYGWMALVIFVWFGRISPLRIEFWFLMQLAMACGFLTAYPMNWWLVKAGIKTAM